jgi:hypothetical protein
MWRGAVRVALDPPLPGYGGSGDPGGGAFSVDREANDLGAILVFEVAEDGVADHFVQLFQIIRNSEDLLAKSLGRVATFQAVRVPGR